MAVIIFSIILSSVILNSVWFLWGIIESSMEFDINKRNVPIHNAKYYYENSNLNMTTCKVKSFFFNLFFFGYNFAVILYAIFYYLTRKGREGNFDV